MIRFRFRLSTPKKVEFTFEKKRNEFVRRTYIFDTIYDQRVWTNRNE